MSIVSADKFQQSCMGILHRVLARFNQRFSGIAQANWHNYEVTYSHTTRFRLLEKPAERMQTVKLRLIDRIGSDDSQEICRDMLVKLAELDVTATLGKNLIKDAYHLCLI